VQTDWFIIIGVLMIAPVRISIAIFMVSVISGTIHSAIMTFKPTAGQQDTVISNKGEAIEYAMQALIWHSRRDRLLGSRYSFQCISAWFLQVSINRRLCLFEIAPNIGRVRFIPHCNIYRSWAEIKLPPPNGCEYYVESRRSDVRRKPIRVYPTFESHLRFNDDDSKHVEEYMFSSAQSGTYPCSSPDVDSIWRQLKSKQDFLPLSKPVLSGEDSIEFDSLRRAAEQGYRRGFNRLLEWVNMGASIHWIEYLFGSPDGFWLIPPDFYFFEYSVPGGYIRVCFNNMGLLKGAGFVRVWRDP